MGAGLKTLPYARDRAHMVEFGKAPWKSPRIVAVCYDESDGTKCPSCAEELKPSSGRKQICLNCGFVVACCN